MQALQGCRRLHQGSRETLKQDNCLEKSNSLQQDKEGPLCDIVEVRQNFQQTQQHVGDMRTMGYRLRKAGDTE